MDQAPVVDVIEDGRKLIEALDQGGISVTSAFWAKAGDDDRWYIYIVSPLVLTEGVTMVYRRIHPIMRQLRAQTFWIDPFEIKLLSPQSPMAEAAAKVGGSYPGITRFGGTQLGGVAVEGAVIYPSSANQQPVP
jgi:hypothetical protein